MKKALKALLFVLSTLVGLLFIQPAFAQQTGAYQRAIENQWLAAHTAATTGFVDGYPLLPQAWPAGSIGGYNGYGGGYGRFGYPGGYATAGPIGRRERTIETTAACAAIGAGAGGLKGLLIGAGSCLAGNVVYDVVSGRRVRKLREQEAQAFQVQADQEENDRHMANTQRVEAEQRAAAATRWLFNRSGQQAVITDGGKQVCLEGRCFMRPGENWQVDRPASGQWSVVLEFPKGPGMTQLPGEVRSVGSQGWEIVAPAEVR